MRSAAAPAPITREEALRKTIAGFEEGIAANVRTLENLTAPTPAWVMQGRQRLLESLRDQLSSGAWKAVAPGTHWTVAMTRKASLENQISLLERPSRSILCEIGRAQLGTHKLRCAMKARYRECICGPASSQDR